MTQGGSDPLLSFTNGSTPRGPVLALGDLQWLFPGVSPAPCWQQVRAVRSAAKDEGGPQKLVPQYAPRNAVASTSASRDTPLTCGTAGVPQTHRSVHPGEPFSVPGPQPAHLERKLPGSSASSVSSQSLGLGGHLCSASAVLSLPLLLPASWGVSTGLPGLRSPLVVSRLPATLPLVRLPRLQQKANNDNVFRLDSLTLAGR